MPENDNEKIAEIQSQIDLNKKQTELRESEIALLEKEKALTAKQSEPASVEKEELTRKKEIAEAEKSLAEVEQAKITAMLPQGKTAGATGTIATEKFGYLSEIVAYGVVKKSAVAIAKRINELDIGSKDQTPKAKILIVNELNFAKGEFPLLQLETLLESFKVAFKTQQEINDNIKPEYEEPPRIQEKRKVEAAIATPATIASAVLGSLSFISDVMSYFKGDYAVKGRDFTITDEALMANVAGQIKKDYHVYIFNFNWLEESEVLNAYTEVLQQKQKLEESVAYLKSSVINVLSKKKQAIENDLEKIKSSVPPKQKEINNREKQLESISSQIEDTNKAILNSENLIKGFTAFSTSITESSGDKQPLILEAAMRKHIKTRRITHLLRLHILSSGGEATTIKKPLSWGGDTSYIGGAVISFILSDVTGKVEAADTNVAFGSLYYRLGSDQKNLKITETLKE